MIIYHNLVDVITSPCYNPDAGLSLFVKESTGVDELSDPPVVLSSGAGVYCW